MTGGYEMVIFWIFAGITIFGLIGYLAQVIAVHRTMKTGKAASTGAYQHADYRPPVSIIKPLKGLDDNLFDNLESFCIQDYPKYEILFAVQDYNDPAYKIVRKIRDKHPDRDISIIVEKCDDGLNPKVSNLIPAYRYAKYPFILISDSNVMVDKDYLREIITHMENPDVGLVTNVIRGIRGRTIGSIFENLHLNSFIAGSVCFLDRFLKMPCVIGKSMLMRRSDLDAIGGFKAVKDVLAEDYIIGKKIHERGRKVVLSNYVINNVNEYWGVGRFLNRHTRWGKLRWKIGGVKYLPELFGNAVFMSSLPLVMVDLSRLTVSFAVLVSSIKIAGDLYIGRKLKSEMNPLFYLLSPIKDLIVGIIWFVPILSNTVAWRGNRYLIGEDSVLSAYQENIWSWRYRFMDVIRAWVV
jgi:ceramide glucosyltransferase